MADDACDGLAQDFHLTTWPASGVAWRRIQLRDEAMRAGHSHQTLQAVKDRDQSHQASFIQVQPL